MVYSESEPNGTTQVLDAVFAALAHRSRRDIVHYLATRPAAPRMKVVAADNELSPQLLNKHAAALEKAGLVSRVMRGRHSHLVLHPHALGAAEQWIQQTRAFWEHQLDSLETYIAELNGRIDPNPDPDPGTDPDHEAEQT